MTTETTKPYLLENEGEVARLQVQHDFWKHFTNGDPLMPDIQADLSKRDNVEVLETGTANGAWMRDVATSLPNARFIGTDITISFFPSETSPHISFEEQDISKPAPPNFHERFDLLHQRLVLPSLGPSGNLETTLKSLSGTIKPGGWIQLQEADYGSLPASNGPAMTLFLDIIKRFSPGGDPKFAERFKAILESLGFENVQEMKLSGEMGAACSDRDLGMKQAYASLSAVKGLVAAIKGKGMFPDDQLDALPERYIKELETQGGALPCRIVWGRKSAN